MLLIKLLSIVLERNRERERERNEVAISMYSEPSPKGHSLERTPLHKGHKFLAAIAVNACGAPSHQRTLL